MSKFSLQKYGPEKKKKKRSLKPKNQNSFKYEIFHAQNNISFLKYQIELDMTAIFFQKTVFIKIRVSYILKKICQFFKIYTMLHIP